MTTRIHTLVLAFMDGEALIYMGICIIIGGLVGYWIATRRERRRLLRDRAMVQPSKAKHVDCTGNLYHGQGLEKTLK